MKNYKILVIEDDETVRENVAELLELTGYELRTAENGVEGVKIASDFVPDLIVCDVMMPKLDGYGVLKILSEKDNLKHIPFIFLSAKSEKQDRRKAMGLGADDYLTKPFDDVELLDIVELRLKKHRQIANHTKQEKQDAKPNLDTLIKNNAPFKYHENSYVYRQNESPSFVFYLVSGSVKIVLLNEDGKELITEIVGAGEVFGYDATIKEIDHENAAITIEECEIKKLNKTEFFDLMSNDTAGCINLLKQLSKKVENYETRLLELAYDSAKKRILTRLHKIFKENNNYTEISRTNLSHLVGTTPETIARTFTELKKEKVISTNGNAIKLENEAEFKKLMSWY